MTRTISADRSGLDPNGSMIPGFANPWLFFRRWLKNPLEMGSVIPSSASLCRRIARQVRRAEDEAVIELGAGTGVITAALLKSGVPAERLFVVEIVPEMADWLRKITPGANVLCGDARDLSQLMPPEWHGKIGTVIVGIPLVLLPFETQKQFVDAIQAVAPGRGFLLYSYCVTSPLPAEKLGLVAKREAWTPANFPPASVWRYTPIAQA